MNVSQSKKKKNAISDDKDKINSTTITACSTGFPGAIAVIRLTGHETRNILESCFFSKNHLAPRLVRTGRINAEGLSDTATAVFFEAPDSYTGEDMAEISIHANPILVQKVLQQLIKNGAVCSQRGEFTMRAFLNGKMDLTAAEAVADIINAESESEIKYAYRQMKGELRQKIDFLQDTLKETLAAVDAAIDFPEENIENETFNHTEVELATVKSEIKKLLESYESGRFVKDGVKAAIIGGVNVGKSSLLNALLKKERAIVTEIPGTTRDTLEDRFEFNGQKFIITDTAGIRKSSDVIEAEGIERTKKAALESDVIIAVTEAGRPFDKQIREVLEKMASYGKKIITAENKSDIFKAVIDGSVAISAKTGENIEKLKCILYKATAGLETDDTIKTTGIAKAAESETVTVTGLRHYQALLEADKYLSNAETGIKNGLTADFVASDIMYAYNELGRITGKIGADDIIDTVFSRFCVGK